MPMNIPSRAPLAARRRLSTRELADDTPASGAEARHGWQTLFREWWARARSKLGHVAAPDEQQKSDGGQPLYIR